MPEVLIYQPRLGEDLRTIHLWDGVMFDKGTPVAICESRLFPRSLRFVDYEPTKVALCDNCTSPKRWKEYAKDSKLVKRAL